MSQTDQLLGRAVCRTKTSLTLFLIVFTTQHMYARGFAELTAVKSLIIDL